MKFKLLRRIIGKVYLFAKFEGDKLLNEARLDLFNSKARIGEGTKCSSDAIISNSSSDKDKITIGKNCWIRGYLLVYENKGKIVIGNETFIGPGTTIWSANQIVIGNRVLISHNVNIHDNDSHPLDAVQRAKHFGSIFANTSDAHNFDFASDAINIGDDVWIGFNVTIMKGVSIGRGAIIGANTMVTKNVEEYAVIVEQKNNRVIKYMYPEK